MPINHILNPIALNSSLILAKTIRYREGRTYWNTFLASVMQDPNSHAFDALAHLHLRCKPRAATVTSTYGMTVDRSLPILHNHTWSHRRLVPPPEGSNDPRAVVHETPMYTAEEKKGYSKPQSTTLIAPAYRIQPSLFSGWAGSENQIMSGVFFPLDEKYCLLNRVCGTDSSTVIRPYDSSSSPTEPWANARTIHTLLADPVLQKTYRPNGRYSEILARLKMYAHDIPLHTPANVLEGKCPGFLICYSSNYQLWILSVCVTIKRAFDFLLCRQRQYGSSPNYSVPIVIYEYDSSEYLGISNNMSIRHVFSFTGKESILELINSFCQNPLVINSQLSMNILREILLAYIYMQQYIYFAASNFAERQPPFSPEHSDMPWNHYLKWDLPETFRGTDLFYLETLKALVTLCQQNQTILSEMSPRFRNFIQKFLAVAADEKLLNEKYITFAIKADFVIASYELETKINPRYPIAIPPNFPYQYGQRRICHAIHTNNLEEFERILHTPGVNLNKPNLDLGGGTPLFTAIDRNLTPSDPNYTSAVHMVRALLALSEQINFSISTKNQTSILMSALWGFCRNEPAIIQQILDNPNTPNINARNDNKNSALYFGVFPASLPAIFPDDVLRMILNHPALDINLPVGSENKTVFTLILKKGPEYHPVILEFLKHPNLEFNDEVFTINNDEIKMAALQVRKRRNGHLSQYEQSILKFLRIHTCHSCRRIPSRINAKHHCRSCLNGFCDKCGTRIKATGEWFCSTCYADNCCSVMRAGQLPSPSSSSSSSSSSSE